MILVAGATGSLGRHLVPQLGGIGEPLRAIVRDPGAAAGLDRVEVVKGDVCDPATLAPAVAGVDTVVCAVSGFGAAGDVSVESVDRDGTIALIDAAVAAGVTDFVLVSVAQAGPRHPMDLMRAKYAAEQHLKASGMAWTILRPSLSTETWAHLIGRPLQKHGKTMVYGRGKQPVNFVSARDVAAFVRLAVSDPAMRNRTFELGGPENLTMNEFVKRFSAVTGATGSIGHYPLPVMRILAVALRLHKQQMARHIQAGVYIDTRGLAVDGRAARREYPALPLTSVDDVFRADYGTAGAPSAAAAYASPA